MVQFRVSEERNPEPRKLGTVKVRLVSFC